MAAENPSSDPLIDETENRGRREGKGRAMQAANLFDLRRIIGGLFVVYGVLLVVLGVTDSDAEIKKAADININLWAGLGMLVFGLLMIAWALTRPLGDELQEAEAGEGGERTSRPAPRGTDAAALGSHQRSGGTRRNPPGSGGGTGPAGPPAGPTTGPGS